MSEPFVHIDQLNLRFRRNVVLKDLSWTIRKGEQWLVTGQSGSGKTVLAKIIAGLLQANVKPQITYSGSLPAKVLFVAQWYPFKDKQNTSNFYYQQRYNSTEAENTATVIEELTAYAERIGKANDAQIKHLLESLHLLHRQDAPLIQLSSGEHKKLQLSKALLLQPQLLILDNPYTGLDVATRQNLNQLIDKACAEGVQLIMISNEDEAPDCITYYGEMKEGQLVPTSTRPLATTQGALTSPCLPHFLSMKVQEPAVLVQLNQVNVHYGDHHVLKNVSWTVKRGDKWLLQGPNGSGKSTLLSLLTGDHPQAYANDLYLFGRKRGTGESIWDIKKNIGFISPELQWYFEASSTVFQAIASGFFDTAGLFRSITPNQSAKVRELMVLFDLADEEHTLLTQLPLGKQRLALLARAIIKNPPLLILDEPCQGLDYQQTQRFNQLVDSLCATTARTLIYVGHFENRLPDCIEHRLILNKGVAFTTEHRIQQEINT